MNCTGNQKPSVWLFINRNNDIGDTIKAFSTREAAEKYFYEYIGRYIYDCIKEEDKDQLRNFLTTIKTSETGYSPYLYDPKDNGEEFYIEEVVIDE